MMVFTRLLVAYLFAGLLTGITCLSSNAQPIEAPAAEAPLGGPDTLVICPVEFQSALNDWLEYRERQGHVIDVVAPSRNADGIKQQIRETAITGNLKFVFVIGDVQPAHPGQAASPFMPIKHSPLNYVPIEYVPAKVNVLFGSDTEIATDNGYADLDDDGLPDLAIGRLPADTPTEVAEFLDRVMAYENNAAGDQHWRRNINFVAGLGGFGGMIDGLLENTAKQIITDLVPEHFQTSMTFGSWRSPYCPDPRRFSQTAIGRFNEGCMFWVYIGHGHPTKLDRVHLPDQSHSILDENSVQEVCCTAGNPIAIFLSCYTGAIDHQSDCLAEMMLRQPCGPIAAICGTRVTMPYAMSLMSVELVDEYLSGNVETLGELMQVAKRRMVVVDQQMESTTEHESDQYREMIRGMGKFFSPRPDLLAAECLEHVQMIHLFGDPLLKLKRATHIPVSTVTVAKPGGELLVSGIAPAAGELCVELVYNRDRFRQRPPRRREFVATDSEFRNYQTAYDAAHDLTCDGCHQDVAAGPFEIKLKVPLDASGKCSVRCMLNSANDFALGSAAVEIVAED